MTSRTMTIAFGLAVAMLAGHAGVAVYQARAWTDLGLAVGSVAALMVVVGVHVRVRRSARHGERVATASRALVSRLEAEVAEGAARVEAVDRDVEALTYSVSHDLRAPLRAISGFAEILVRRHRSQLGAEAQHYLDNVVEASARMGRLIDDLLSYTRIGRRAGRDRTIPLDQIVAQAVAALAPRLEAEGAEVVVEGTLPTVRGDWTLLSQIVVQLVDNAVVHRRPDAAPRVRISCRAEGNDVVLRVADNGIGIPREHHDRIFTLFQRLHGSDEHPGTGIGLAIVKRSAETLGGRVRVESETGAGSTFCVELPGGPSLP